jgi:hypothetical protein
VKLVGPVLDRVRTLFNIRVSRGVPLVGHKPGIGARIYRDDLRMSVQAGMTDSLWHWLVRQGWREVTYRPDRRRYRDLPAAYVTQLVDAAAEQRERVLDAAIANATLRPVPSRRGPWANTRGR